MNGIEEEVTTEEVTATETEKWIAFTEGLGALYRIPRCVDLMVGM